jgi:hypothetical protein
MRNKARFLFLSAAVVSLTDAATFVWPSGARIAPNGISLPEGYRDWRLIAPSHRTDKNHIRVILGNDAAIEAARAGKTNPWPDGAELKPYGGDAGFVQECFGCHVPVAYNDYVFTRYVQLP